MFSQPKFYPAIEREDGSYAFYPWSRNSNGYLVGKDEGERINSIFSQIWLSATPISIVLGKYIDGLMGLSVALAVIVGACIVYHLKVRWFVKDRPTLPPRPKSEFNAEFNRMYSRGQLIMLTIFCLLFVVAGVWILSSSRKPEDHNLGLACVAFFGLGVLVLGHRAITWRPPVG